MFKFQYKQQLKLRMIDYYEAKSQPITRVQVWEAYWKVRKNKGGMCIDGMSREVLDKTRDKQLVGISERAQPASGGTRSNRTFFHTGDWYIHKMYIFV